MLWEKIHDLLLLFIYKFIEEAELLLVAFQEPQDLKNNFIIMFMCYTTFF